MNRNPALQIWTQDTSDPSTYRRRTSQVIPLLSCNGLEPGSSNNVYHCDLRLEYRVTVQPGDILGMYLARNGHFNYDRLPVFFDTSSQSASDQLPYHRCFDRVDVCSNEEGGGRALLLVTLDVMPTSLGSLTTQTTTSPMTPSQTTDVPITPPQTTDVTTTPLLTTDDPTTPSQTTDATTPLVTTDAPITPPQTHGVC